MNRVLADANCAILLGPFAASARESILSRERIHCATIGFEAQSDASDLQCRGNQAIMGARCRESSSIFRASGSYNDSDFLN